MKKTIVILAVLLLLLLTSCLPETPPPGIWMSEEPRIVLYFKPDYQLEGMGDSMFFGVSEIDGVERKVIVQFGHRLTLQLLDITEPREGGVTGHGIRFSGAVLVGTYRVNGDELTYTLNETFRGRTGIDNITFQRIEDYEPLDPEWLANFVFNP